LTSIANAGPGSVNVNLYQLAAANSDWVQGTTGIDGTGAHFNNKLPGQPWAGGNSHAAFVAGTDYLDTVLGSYVGPSNTADGGQTFDLGNGDLVVAAQGSLGSDLNLIIMDQTGGSNFLRIASLENTGFTGPQLMVDFTPVPEPGTFALVFGGLALGVIAIRRRKRA
jgi:hypothetical protein